MNETFRDNMRSGQQMIPNYLFQNRTTNIESDELTTNLFGSANDPHNCFIGANENQVPYIQSLIAPQRHDKSSPEDGVCDSHNNIYGVEFLKYMQEHSQSFPQNLQRAYLTFWENRSSPPVRFHPNLRQIKKYHPPATLPTNLRHIKKHRRPLAILPPNSRHSKKRGPPPENFLPDSRKKSKNNSLWVSWDLHEISINPEEKTLSISPILHQMNINPEKIAPIVQKAELIHDKEKIKNVQETDICSSQFVIMVIMNLFTILYCTYLSRFS
jgi:hypothetical protein